MKYILFIFIIAFTDFVFGQGDAPPLLQGQYQGSKSVGSFIQTPNAGVTKINSSTALIETGNNNILVNPSFEHQVFSTGWTVGSGTFTEETVNEIHGKKAAKLVLSAQTMSLTQSSTLYQAQFADSVQGLASVRVKSDVALKVCSIQAGVVSTSNCVDVQSNNKWGLYKVPMSLGATSNGISIASTGAVTGTVYIDDAFVGISNILDVQPVVSAWNDFTMNITATTTNPTKATTRINDEARWRQVGDSIEIHYSYHHNNNAGASAGSGTYLFNLPPGFTINTAKMATAPDSNTRGSIGFAAANGPGGGASGVVKIYSSTSFSMLVDFEDASAINEVGSSNFGLGNASASYSFRAVVPVNELSGSTSTYSSLNKDTDWQSCTPSSSQGFGTPTFAMQCKREGGDLLMKGRFTTTAATAVEARIGLPLWNGVQLFTAGPSIIPALEIGNGFLIRSANSTGHGGPVLIEPSVSYIAFGSASTLSGASSVSLIKATADNVTGIETVSLNARIPIEGWQNSNIIIGQFNGLERCIDSYECTDVFSATISDAGVVTQENIDWINGNCSVLSANYTCTYRSGLKGSGNNLTQPMNCVSVDSSSATSPTATRVYGSSTTDFNASNTAGRGIRVICQKQGVDYIGKTAKAVASDQNVRSIGAVGVDIQSVYFGSGANCAGVCSSGTCLVCNQVGSKITSVTFDSTGNYRLNGIDGLKYNCTGQGVGTSYTVARHSRTSSTSSYAYISFGSGGGVINSGDNSVTCIGIP